MLEKILLATAVIVSVSLASAADAAQSPAAPAGPPAVAPQVADVSWFLPPEGQTLVPGGAVFQQPRAPVSYPAVPGGDLRAGGAVPQAVADAQAAATGFGGPANLPFPGTQGQPDTGLASNVGGTSALAASPGPGSARACAEDGRTPRHSAGTLYLRRYGDSSVYARAR